MAQQRRHFLRGRWIDPAEPEDGEAFLALKAKLTPSQAVEAKKLLVDFSRWKPGPAGRGGERTCRKRDSESEESEEESENEQVPNNKRRMIGSQGGHAHKRVLAGGVAEGKMLGDEGGDEAGSHRCSAQGPGLLELLCMVASSVESDGSRNAVYDSTTGRASLDGSRERALCGDAGSGGSGGPAAEEKDDRPVLPQPYFPATNKSRLANVTAKRDLTLESVVAKQFQAGAGANRTSVASLCSSSPHEASIDAKAAKSSGSGAEEAAQGGATALSACAVRRTEVSVQDGAPGASSCATSMATSMSDTGSPSARQEACTSSMSHIGREGVATAVSSCAARLASSTAAAVDSQQADQGLAAARDAAMPVPAPFANLFKQAPDSGSVVDEGMARYPIGNWSF